MTTNKPGTAVATRAVSVAPIMAEDDFRMMWRIATALAASGVFKDVRQAEQAFAKILLGRDLGLSPAESMNAMDFVKGNVMLRAVTLAAFVKRHDNYDYRILEHSDTACGIRFFARSLEVAEDGTYQFGSGFESLGVSVFTIEDAKRAKLVRADSAWTSHPRNMLFARAMSNGVKWYCPDVVRGVPVYTEGDSFEDRPQLGTGDDAVPTGEPLPEAVEDVLVRATELGHVGLSDRATAEMTILGQSDEMIEGWVERATVELDKMAAIADAQVVEPEAESTPDTSPL